MNYCLFLFLFVLFGVGGTIQRITFILISSEFSPKNR